MLFSCRGVDEIRNRAAILQRLKQHEGIVNVTETSGAIGRSLNISILEVETENNGSQNLTVNLFDGGENYLETMGIELISGEIDRMNRGEGGVVPILVNETFVKSAGWGQPIGRRVGNFEVVGLVKDFHYMPLQQAIGSLFIRPFNDSFLDSIPANRLDSVAIDLIIATTGQDDVGLMTYTKEVIDEFSNQPVIEVLSLEAIWNERYEDETRTVGLVGVFSGLSILISLLGLGGMVTYNNERRGKEMAIRKVLGAPVSNILTLLGFGIFKVLAIAAIPAFLGAWYLTSMWLQRFAYRIDIEIFPFVLAFIIVSVCSTIVMITQTWRVANESPLRKIKYE